MSALGSLLHSREPLCVITWQTLSLVVTDTHTHTHALMLKASMPGQTLILDYTCTPIRYLLQQCTDRTTKENKGYIFWTKDKNRQEWNQTRECLGQSHRGVSSVTCHHFEGQQAESELSRGHSHAGYWRWWCQWQHQRPLGCFLCL